MLNDYINNCYKTMYDSFDGETTEKLGKKVLNA
jgi:hypothetical protein